MEKHIVKGKIVQKEGKYFLDVAGKMQEMPVGLLVDEKFLKAQVGQEVEVLQSNPMPGVVALKTLRGPRIIHLCNIPNWDLVTNIISQPSPEMIRTVADKLLQEGTITQEVHGAMVQGLG